jgi:hypothetical protein
MLFNALLAAAAASAAIVSGLPTAAPPPTGGVDVNATSPLPFYAPGSDFDFQSLNLALNQEWIELDLFNYVSVCLEYRFDLAMRSFYSI